MNETEGLVAVRENERSWKGEVRGKEREELWVGTKRWEGGVQSTFSTKTEFYFDLPRLLALFDNVTSPRWWAGFIPFNKCVAACPKPKWRQYCSCCDVAKWLRYLWYVVVVGILANPFSHIIALLWNASYRFLSLKLIDFACRWFIIDIQVNLYCKVWMYLQWT